MIEGMTERRRKKHDWDFKYYESTTGEVPVKEFINEQEPTLQYLILLGLRQVQMENVDLDSRITVPIEGSSLLELKIERNGTTYSILYFESENRTYIGLHGCCRPRIEELDGEVANTAIQRMNEHREK